MKQETRSVSLLALPLRVSDILECADKVSLDRQALVEVDGGWTYRQLESAVGAARALLLDLEVRSGDRVMIVCENCREFVALFLALASLDAWTVPVNARLSAREIDEIKEHSGARRVIYTTRASSHGMAHAKRNDAVIREIPDLGTIGISALNKETHQEYMDPNSSDRVAIILYTSGTTGRPKGVMLSHKNLLFAASVSARIRSLTPEDRLLGVMPMSHVSGLSLVLIAALLTGASVYLLPRFDAIAMRAALERHQLSVVLGVPAMFTQFVDYASLRGIDSFHFPSLRIISSSGAPLYQSVKSDVEKLFGLKLSNGYGMTECSPGICTTRIEAPRKDTSVGPVYPGVEVKFLDSSRKTVCEGEVGELWVRGPNVMKGYYRAPSETYMAIDEEGWFNTHDLARMENGNVFIVGRTKELIIRSGFKVYPAEIEGVLEACPGVIRSAVIGQCIETSGEEEIVAFVELPKGTTVTKAELAKHATQHLAFYKRPSQIRILSEMPLTLSGKVRKDKLEEWSRRSRNFGINRVEELEKS
jgi:long-chain acyl-CoA synthetase